MSDAANENLHKGEFTKYADFQTKDLQNLSHLLVLMNQL